MRFLAAMTCTPPVEARLTPRLCAIALASIALGGCLKVPLPPSDNNTDAYGWKAPIDIPPGETYYRLGIPEDLADWMKGHAVQSLAVFDANGKLQRCGLLAANSNNPLATVPQVIAGHVSLYDPAACGDGAKPKICFKGQQCAIPDSCSPQIVDVVGTSLEGISTVAQLLAAANANPVPANCRPDKEDAPRDCDAADEPARNLARQTAQRKTEAQEFMANFGITSDSQGLPSARASSTPESLDRNDLLITLDRLPAAVPQLTLQWNKPAGLGLIGTASLTCYNSDGSTFDEGINIQPIGASEQGGPMLEAVGTACLVRSYRLVLHSSVPDLELEGVVATTFAPKPFLQSGGTHFWIAPDGAAPYSVFLEPGRSGCGSELNVYEVSKLPRVREESWPPPVGAIGTPVANERSAWILLLANRRDLVAWMYWLALVGTATALALIVTLLRWAWLRRYARE